jgi:beta-phosphoglucomutase family hydrolase
MYHKFDGIIFDMDGTLVDSGKLHELAWSQSLTYFGIPVDRPLMRSLAGVPTKETVEILIKTFGCTVDAALSEINDYKERVVRENICRYVKPTRLHEIAKEYYGVKPMAVGTGAYTEEARSILDACGLLALVDFVVGADQVANPKPAPDTFLKCAELMGVPPQNCVVFEDSKLGLRAAEAAGMAGVDVLETFAIENDYFL